MQERTDGPLLVRLDETTAVLTLIRPEQRNALNPELFAALREGDVLVDDQARHRHLWEGVGGIFVHHRDARTTLGELAGYFPLDR